MVLCFVIYLYMLIIYTFMYASLKNIITGVYIARGPIKNML